MVPVVVGGALLMSVGRVIPARADEERTFCGKTLDGWIEAGARTGGRQSAG
jgi:hypothetical protein